MIVSTLSVVSFFHISCTPQQTECPHIPWIDVLIQIEIFPSLMAQFEGFNDAPWEGMKYVQSLWNDIFMSKLLVEKKLRIFCPIQHLPSWLYWVSLNKQKLAELWFLHFSWESQQKFIISQNNHHLWSSRYCGLSHYAEIKL